MRGLVGSGWSGKNSGDGLGGGIWRTVFEEEARDIAVLRSAGEHQFVDKLQVAGTQGEGVAAACCAFLTSVTVQKTGIPPSNIPCSHKMMVSADLSPSQAPRVLSDRSTTSAFRPFLATKALYASILVPAAALKQPESANPRWSSSRSRTNSLRLFRGVAPCKGAERPIDNVSLVTRRSAFTTEPGGQDRCEESRH